MLSRSLAADRTPLQTSSGRRSTMRELRTDGSVRLAVAGVRCDCYIIPVRPFLSRLTIPMIGLAVFAAFTILYWNYPYLYKETISAIILLAPYSHPFIDWEWIPSSIECWHRGVDVYSHIPCYVVPNVNLTFDYSPLWLRLAFIRYAYGWTNLFGTSFAVLFLISLAFLPSRRCGGIFAFGIVLYTVISSATVELIERANGDLIMFFMIMIGVLACRSWLPVRLAGYAVITLSGLLKFYPLVALIIASRERPVIFASISLAVMAVLAAFVSFYYEELVPVIAHFSSGIALFHPLNWGAKQLPRGLGFIISKVAATRFHWDATSADALGRLADGILLFLLIVQTLATMIWLGHRFRLQHAVAHYLSAREADFLAAGGALICGCFFAGDNGLYRGIYFLFALPALLTLAHQLSLRSARAAFRGTCVAIVFVLWYPFLRKGIRVAVKALGNPVESWYDEHGVIGHQGLDRASGLVFWLFDQVAWWWIATVLLAVLSTLMLSSQLFRSLSRSPP
jgi:hypothetical protein